MNPVKEMELHSFSSNTLEAPILSAGQVQYLGFQTALILMWRRSEQTIDKLKILSIRVRIYFLLVF